MPNKGSNNANQRGVAGASPTLVRSSGAGPVTILPIPQPLPFWRSRAIPVRSRRGCGQVPAQSVRRVPAQMWASPGADVGASRRRCGPHTLGAMNAALGTHTRRKDSATSAQDSPTSAGPLLRPATLLQKRVTLHDLGEDAVAV